MAVSAALVATTRGPRYIKQLVSHMAHKVTTELNDSGRGTITLSHGQCVLTPEPAYFTMTATADTPEQLERVQDVVTRHLLRFATQEELEVAWSPLADLVHPAVADYTLTHSTPADVVLRDLAAETGEVTGGAATMQITHDEGVLLTMLVQLTGARHAIEVGVFTGYSSICIARGLPADGHLLALDVSDEWTSIAARHWEKAGVSDRIELRLGPAVESLRALPVTADFDFAFIDADKENYAVYYEEILLRLRPGGVIVLDNVLQGGRVLDPVHREPRHVVMRELNDLVAGDNRVDAVMLPLRDGVTIIRKR
jgi:predicted O-methyltransferase YrrM